MFGHYVVLYVASSVEGIDGLEDLLTENANLLPKEYKNGLFDPNGMREHFLIVHDEKDGPDNQQFQEVQVLQEMRNRFGPGNTLASIQSRFRVNYIISS